MRCDAAENVYTEIRVKRSELLADLRSLAYAEADKESDESHAKHQLMDICEDGNVERVTRKLNLAASELKEKLYPYTKKPIEEGMTGKSDYVEPEEYLFEMKVPNTMSVTTLEHVTLLIHEYMTAKVMEDSMMRLYPGYAVKWQVAGEKVIQAIGAAINRRLRPMKRKLSVF